MLLSVKEDIARNNMIHDLLSMWKKVVIFLFDVIFWHLPAGTEENQENPLRNTSG
jgi:hypothetical protein